MIKVKIFFSFKLFVTVTILATYSQLHTRSLVKTHGTYSQLFPSNSDKIETREVKFTNDWIDIVELDLISQHHSLGNRENECLAHFKQIPITIRAEKDYLIENGDEISVETKDRWELSINEISNEALLSLKTFRDLVLDHFLPKKRIVNFMDEWIWTPYNQAKLFIYQKMIARYATTTIIIHTDIDPEYESIRCSDIILDLDKLAGENKLAISIEHANLLNMRVTIKPIKTRSLPNTFF